MNLKMTDVEMVLAWWLCLLSAGVAWLVVRVLGP